MPDSPEKPKKPQVNIRLDGGTHERLVAWAFLETGEARPGAFVNELITGIINAAAENDPQIDALVQLRAEHRSAEPEQ